MSRKGATTIEEALEQAEILSGPGAKARVEASDDRLDYDADDLAADVLRKRDVVDALNAEWAVVLMGSRAVVVRELGEEDAPSHDRVRVLSIEAFGAFMANQSCFVEGFEKKHGRVVPVPQFMKKAPLWLTAKTRRTFNGVEFYPDAKHAPGHKGYFNLWRGYSVTPDRLTKPADRWRKYAVFRDHLLTNICAGNEAHFAWVFAWFASILQRPRDRLGTSLVLRGDQGTGKTVAGEVVGSLIEAHYFLVDNPRYLVGQFNAHQASCLLLQVDEGFWAGDKTAEGQLKGLITAKKLMIEAKGIDPIQVENRVNVMFSSNEGWVVPAGMGERRHAVFDVASNAKENHGYFEELYAQLANGGREALLADLLDLDLDAPGAANPRVIPKTEALLEQKIRSFDPITSWWYGRLVEGSQTHRAAIWRGHVPISACFGDYLRTAERIGVRRRAAEIEFGLRMRELLPDIYVKRRMEDVEIEAADGRRETVRKYVRCYEFPALEASRVAFEALLHQEVAWEPTGEVEAESAGASGENSSTRGGPEPDY